MKYVAFMLTSVLVAATPIQKVEAYDFVTATASIGSCGMFRETIDANYALNEGQTVLARINVAADNRDGFRDVNESDRLFVAPVITYKPSSDWHVTVEEKYMNDRRLFDRGIVAQRGNVFAVPHSRFLGESNDGPMHAEHGIASIRVEHDANKDSTVSFTQMVKEGVLVGTAMGRAGDLVHERRTTQAGMRRRDLLLCAPWRAPATCARPITESTSG